jgi:hypothetical protein
MTMSAVARSDAFDSRAHLRDRVAYSRVRSIIASDGAVVVQRKNGEFHGFLPAFERQGTSSASA